MSMSSTKIGAWIKDKARTAAYTVTRKSPAEIAFLECTNNDQWGPTNTQMLDVTRYCDNYENWGNIKQLFYELFEKDGKKHVRQLNKGLRLMEYMIVHGGQNMRREMQMYTGHLRDCTYRHEFDTGEKAALEAVVRKKAQDIMDLMNDDDLYNAERDKAQKLRGSLSAVTHDEYGGSYESSTYGGGYGVGNSYDRGYDDGERYRESSRRPEVRSQKPPVQEDDYYSDDEPAPPPPKKQTGAFNPFQDSGAPSQQPSQPVQPTQNSYEKRKPTAEPFNPFKQEKPVQQPAQSSGGDLLGLFSTPAQNSGGSRPAADDLLFGFGTPAQPAPQQPVAQPPRKNDDFLDFLGTPVPAQQPVPQQRPVQQPPQQQKPGMFQEFGDLATIDLTQGEERKYGRAGFQQRGTGTTLGGRS